MHRVFVPQEQLPIITGTDVHYLKAVLRLKAGDRLELLDGTGKVYQARIRKVEKEKIACEVISSRQEETEPKVKVALAQALTKGSKMDFVVEKCTELGVSQIVPMLTERTVAKEAKLDRWRKLAKEAAEQSGRTVIPAIASLTPFEEILKMKSQFDLALIPWELEKENTLKIVLKTGGQANRKTDRLLVLIGPEGGFSQKEISLAKEAGLISVSLGERILRAETAGMAVLSAIMYELCS